MALSDILKKYGDTTGIMQQPATSGIVPYKSVASSYPVYNKDTDTLEDQQTFSYEPVGIMAQPEGKPVGIDPPFMPDMGIPFPEPKAEQPFVTGPTGVISYGTTEEGTPRVLTDYRTGEMTYADTGEPYTPPPVEPETPTQPEEPAVDPCPPGYQLVDGVCQPIQQERRDRDEDEPEISRVQYSETQKEASALGLKYKLSDSDLFGPEAQTVFEVNPFYKTPNAIAGTVLGFFNPIAGLISGAYFRNQYNKSLESLLDKGLIEEISDGKYRTTPNYSRGIAQSAVGTQEIITKDSALGKEIEAFTGIKSGYDDGRRVRDTELEKKAEQAGFTRREIESGRALAELRDVNDSEPSTKEEREKAFKDFKDDDTDNRAVKAYREAQSKKYTQKEKDDFKAKVDALKGASAEKRMEAGKNLPKQDKDSGGGSDKGGGKIVCTMMNESYGFGSFRNKVWLAHSSQLSKEYEIGYHILFLPLVKYAKQKGFTNSIVKNALEHIARHRTIDIRKQKYNKVDMLGRAYRTLLEPLCYITGRIKLWKKK